MGKHLRLFFILAILTPSGSIAKHAFTAPSGLKEFTGKYQALPTPELIVTPHGTYQTTIHLEAYTAQGTPEGSSIELYRSMNSSSGYNLIATLPPGGQMEYTDADLKPRTTFYYRARAVNGSAVSDYAYTSHTTESKWYDPEFTAASNGTGTAIVFTLTDKSYQEDSYRIERLDGGFYGTGGETADSGRTVTYYDYNVSPGTTYKYKVEALLKDEGAPLALIATVTISTAPLCNGGSILREVWTDIPGIDVSSIPLHEDPDNSSVLTIFEAPSNQGSNYGARIRGYICVPQTGNYTFWIASDDKSELYLSTDYTSGNKVKIASVNAYTSPRQWDRYSSQQSAPIRLEAGRMYYIEALHKEASGGDNLAVGWKLPDGTLERPIPGNRLIQYEPPSNKRPTMTFSSPQNGQQFTAPATVNFAVNAVDQDGSVARVEFYYQGSRIGEDHTAPFTFQWNNVPAGTYKVDGVVYDEFEAAGYASVNFSVTSAACSGSGGITREVWRDVAGAQVSDIPVNTPPSSRNVLQTFQSGPYEGTNYGSRWRGYVCVPATGNYTFFISSDDQSELWLSTDEQVNNKRLIASVSGHTPFGDYTKYPSQKSALISLVAGRKYYIEALHKEATGGDHLSVGWQLPNGTMERPLTSNRLREFNSAPRVAFTSPTDGQTFTEPASVLLAATATDTDGTITKVEFWNGTTKLGEDTSAPYQYQWTNVQPGNYQILGKAIDNTGSTGTDNVNFTVNEGMCRASGTIHREVWTGITGTSISSIPVNTAPDAVNTLTIFETPNYSGNDYGARVRGYVCVPVTGAYRFWIASDDNSELWLSADDNPANKVRIASVTGYTGVRQWTKYATQQSAPVNLVAGQRYYIEALHKEANGADHLAVGWQLPNGTFERPIPGSRLSGFEAATAQFASARIKGAEEINSAEKEGSEGITLFPNPTANHEVTLTFSSNDHAAWNDASIQIISMTGEVLHEDRITCEANCNDVLLKLKESITPGVYLVNVMKNQKRLTKKLMVK
jgi:hypothetical protein